MEPALKFGLCRRRFLSLCAVVTAATVLAACSTSAPSTIAATTSPHLEPLLPAAVPPIFATCQRPLDHEADGNVGPLLCSKHQVNALAWKYYAQTGSSPILGLGRGATAEAVERALCVTQIATLQERISQATLATAYYGWHFKTQPESILDGSGCFKFRK
jgi:hypothetical protein